MTTIIDHHRLLFFIGVMKAKRKKNTKMTTQVVVFMSERSESKRTR